jgi:Ser/Thr protein kinase RdoA (MazF antagonist)
VTGAPREEPLPGGNLGGAVRVGGTVRRRSGPWTPTVQRLLVHLHDRGVTGVPEPLGTDDQGRDRVGYLPGVVPQYPMPDWVWTDAVLVDAGRFLAGLHDATVDFDARGAVWRLPAREPAEVVCHSDVAPYNMVFVDGRLTGVVDWDTAAPGPRVWDLAYLAYRLVPLTGAEDVIVPDDGAANRARRLRLLCDAYGTDLGPAEVLPVVVERLEALADFTVARAGPADTELRRHAAVYRADARWVTTHAARLGDADGAA